MLSLKGEGVESERYLLTAIGASVGSIFVFELSPS